MNQCGLEVSYCMKLLVISVILENIMCLKSDVYHVFVRSHWYTGQLLCCDRASCDRASRDHHIGLFPHWETERYL